MKGNLRNGHLVIESTLGTMIDDAVEDARVMASNNSSVLNGLVLIFNEKKLDIMKDGRVCDRSEIYRQLHKG